MNNQSKLKIGQLLKIVQTQRRIISNETKGIYGEPTQEGTLMQSDAQTKLEIQQRVADVEEAITTFRIVK